MSAVPKHGHTASDLTRGVLSADRLPSTVSLVGHTHDDRYFTEAEIVSILGEIGEDLDGKSDLGHTHDDRYYTETEADALLAAKASTSHTHDDRYYTEAEVDAAIAAVVPVNGETTVTLNVGPTSGTGQLTLATSPALTFDGVRPVDVALSWYSVVQTVATDVFVITLYDGATQLARARTTGATGLSGLLAFRHTPSAGVHTYTAKLWRFSGTGTATLAATADTPMQLRVNEI